MMKLTVPPTRIVTSFGMSACTLPGTPAAAPRLGKRSSREAHAPKLTVAVASGPLMAA